MKKRALPHLPELSFPHQVFRLGFGPRRGDDETDWHDSSSPGNDPDVEIYGPDEIITRNAIASVKIRTSFHAISCAVADHARAARNSRPNHSLGNWS